MSCRGSIYAKLDTLTRNYMLNPGLGKETAKRSNGKSKDVSLVFAGFRQEKKRIFHVIGNTFFAGNQNHKW